MVLLFKKKLRNVMIFVGVFKKTNFVLILFWGLFPSLLSATTSTLRGDQIITAGNVIIPSTKYLKANNFCSNQPDADVNIKLYNQGLNVYYNDSENKKTSVLFIDKNGITAHKTFSCDGTFNQTGTVVLSTLEVTGSAVVNGNVTLRNGINFTGPITVTGSATVTGSSTFAGISTSSLLSTSSSIHVDGTIAIGLTSGNHANKVIKSFQHGDFLGSDVVSSSTLFGWSYVNTFSAKNILLDVFCSGVVYNRTASSIAVPFSYMAQLIHFPVPGPAGGSIVISESSSFPSGFASYTITSTAFQNSGSVYSFAVTTSGAQVVVVGSFLVETKSMGVVRIGNEYLGTPV